MNNNDELLQLADVWSMEEQKPQAMTNECHGGGGATRPIQGCESPSATDSHR